MGRAAADLSTLGISALARRKCRVCAHPMGEHKTEVQTATAAGTAPGWYPVPGGERYWNGSKWMSHFRASVPQDAPTAPTSPPPGWYLESGRQRWWDGQRWTDHYA